MGSLFSRSCSSYSWFSLDIGELTLSSKVYMMGLIFIGAAPGSTSDGIKIMTFVVILLTL
jgi:trk system potassium uptake protein TrkH|nr:potassium transporter TrkG [Priestia endophytica]